MCTGESQVTAAAAVRTRLGVGGDAGGAVPTQSSVAACARPPVPEEGRTRLGGWEVRLVTWQPPRGG